MILPDSGFERKAATQVREFEKLAFAYFSLVSLTSVHTIQKMAPGISGSPYRLTTLPQTLFFFRKMPPDFWKPLTCGYVAAGVFLQKNGPHIFASP